MVNSICFYSKLYYPDSMNEKMCEKLKAKISRGSLFTNVFCITIATNQFDQLDIVNSRMLRLYPKCIDEIYVVGIAKSMDDAILLVKQITEECFAQRKDGNLREFLNAIS